MAEQGFLASLWDNVNRNFYVFMLRCEKYLKTDRFTDALGIKWHNSEYEKKLVERNAWDLQYIKKQTPEMCMNAVKQNCNTLQFVNDQTPEICMAALLPHSVLAHVEDPAQEIFVEAPQNSWVLGYVKDQTPELCMAAIERDPSAIKYVREQTPELCMAAVQRDGNVLEFVKEQTPEVCLAAVRQDGWALEYVKEQTPELCVAAIEQDPEAIRFVMDPTSEMIIAATERKAMDSEDRVLGSIQLTTGAAFDKHHKTNTVGKGFTKELRHINAEKIHKECRLEDLINQAEAQRSDSATEKKAPVREAGLEL